MVRFCHVFWAFGLLIEGFSYCRSLLSIDDTHLYETYIVCLLIAIGVDADSTLYPLVFAVVGSESEDS